MNKKSVLSLVASIAFLAAMSYAQSTSGDPSQGTQGSSPTTQQDPGMGQGSSSGQSSGSMGQGSSSGQTSGSMDQGSSSMNHGSDMKGEKKMKGCITSEGGQYMLQDKHGKSTPLSGQDLSAHVGHEVTVHGSWAAGGSSDSSAASSGSMSGAKSFNVTNVDMISESCTSSKTKGSSGSMQK